MSSYLFMNVLENYIIHCRDKILTFELLNIRQVYFYPHSNHIV